ncbi:Regulatory protein leu3 [Cladophialophora chaetospira]|uniref:Regulatory protein leu3 n=1 Tax=Cladophialophora chaetospira TaxID=386627 RepID=A0AA38X628_9EURO|nr:Regulatory protein leu3 [Cladophialophora chaetospira]
MQVELAELRRLTSSRVTSTEREPGDAPPDPHISTPLIPESSPDLTVWPSATGPEPATTLPSEPALQGLCNADRYIGGIHLAASHVSELFRIYFTRCHPYLPFSMSRSIEDIYEKSLALFWVICATASPDTARPQFEGPIRGLIADALDPSKGSNVEMVQAILILCMWPFPFTNQKTDASFIYSGIATQISLSIGLHRPASDADFGDETRERYVAEEIRRTTWLACFIVAQIQASRRGVPAMVVADYSLLSSFENPGVSQELSHLCHISHLTVDSTHALGARGSNTAGLVEPSARISLINVFGKQFDDLQRQRFPKPTEIVEIFFLSSRLQLWSFALHNDVPVSANTVQIIYQAREDAVRLIQVASEKNLSLVPFYTRRSVCYAALLLCRIKLGPYGWQDDMIDHHIERAQQALSASEGVKFGKFLAAVTSPDNRDVFIRTSGDKRSPHRSRMGAFLVFDFQRVYADLQQADVPFLSEFLDLDNLPWADFE